MAKNVDFSKKQVLHCNSNILHMREGIIIMGLKSKIGMLICFSLFVANSAFAAEVTEKKTSEVVADNSSTVIAYGAGEWDYLGEWTFRHVIRVNSGGGDLKACITSTTAKVTLGLEKGSFGFSNDKTTTGGSPNCAIWTGLSASTYDIGNVSHYGSYLTMSVWD